MELAGHEYSRLDLEQRTGDLEAIGGIRAVVLDNGVERGTRVLEFRTGGGLRFDVLVDRGMDIGLAEFDDYSFGWRSATGFRHPGLHEVNDEDGLSWLRSMSGLLVTSGLDHTFSPGEYDASHYHHAARPTVRHSLHGRVANIPARLNGYGRRWDGDGAVLWAEGEVRQAAVFGENLMLRRRIETDLGGTEIRLTDTVVNDGFNPTPHMLLYHCDIGWPLLDDGTTLAAPISRTVWTSESAEGKGASALRFGPPVAGFVEQVYQYQLEPDADGRVRVRLTNDKVHRAFELEYDPREFPAFINWVNLRAGEYVVGIEPSTHDIRGEAAARAEGTMIWLGHGDERTYHSNLRFLRS
jgi:hypothetical protein